MGNIHWVHWESKPEEKIIVRHVRARAGLLWFIPGMAYEVVYVHSFGRMSFITKQTSQPHQHRLRTTVYRKLWQTAALSVSLIHTTCSSTKSLSCCLSFSVSIAGMLMMQTTAEETTTTLQMSLHSVCTTDDILFELANGVQPANTRPRPAHTDSHGGMKE